MNWKSKSGPHVAFLGTGAQGASIAADFAVAGVDVTFIDQWPAHIEAIREKGITTRNCKIRSDGCALGACS